MSGGNHHQTIHEVSPMSMSIAHNVWAAEAVKKVLSIPVIASGSITLPELAEEILEQGKGDFIGLGRPLWADPQWPRKVMEGRPEDVRPCIRCNDGCLARGDHQAKTIMCTVNPAICRSEEFKLTRAEKPKKIAVVGGGPAGMEAARVCALRGHEVTLYERRKLGGALLEASVPEFKADIRNLIAYYSTLMGKMNIKVINEEATPQILKKGKYEAVIVAAGSTPIVPNVPGISGPNVTDALKVLNGTAKVGKKVAIIGAGIVGTEVGMYLAEQGKEVVVLEMLDTIMTGITPEEKVADEQRISKLKMCFQTGKRLESVAGKKITLIDRFGMQSEMTADTIVLACGFRPNREIIDALDASRIKVVDNRRLYASAQDTGCYSRRIYCR
jgi:pyruvate/2-oxoglutarate dehydrogenase complex dihydrolipoamide dehydrogenase (E3) component